MKLLLTAIGKRVQLIQHLKTAFTVIGADASPDNAAREFTDGFYVIPRCSDPAYGKEILTICRREKIDALIPLYEPEFPYLLKIREELEKAGTKLILSSEEVVAISNNKKKTAAFFEKYRIPAPRVFEGEDRKGRYLPMIAKPVDGMGSEGIFRIHSPEELRNAFEEINHSGREYIWQELVRGLEYTIDVLCDLDGEPVYIVPRRRVEVRSGEVVKSKTVTGPLADAIIRESRHFLESLRKEGTLIGPLTLQCFANETESGEICVSFIEINCRFGGGVPLSFEAGADYAGALCAMLEGKKVEPAIGCHKELLMMRYDQAVYKVSRKVKAIIFDLDDTLYREEDYAFAAYRNAAAYLAKALSGSATGFSEKDLSADGLFDYMMMLYKRDGRGHIFDQLLVDYNLQFPAAQLVEAYRSTKPQLQLYEDAKELITFAKKKGIKTALLTDGMSRVQHVKIDALGLEEMLDYCLATDDLGVDAEGNDFGKPSTVPYQKVLDVLGVQPEEAIYIGDNPRKDFIACNLLGMGSVRIHRDSGYFMGKEADPGCNAKRSVNDLRELLPDLAQL
ncbi:MAG: ATP-grasp domain-containing protein [Lachnospiraceae bacterium]|nr:ATP-grasp domain-containing protein [Lachnospiraceae bacterium]